MLGIRIPLFSSTSPYFLYSSGSSKGCSSTVVTDSSCSGSSLVKPDELVLGGEELLLLLLVCECVECVGLDITVAQSDSEETMVEAEKD